MKPMLAKTWTRKYNSFPCAVQPKLNGIRALWHNRALYSRDEIQWSPFRLPHIIEHLTKYFPDESFDGELYCHGMSLQEINSRVAVKSIKPHPRHYDISYHIFDIPSSDPFEVRSAILEQLSITPPLVRVPTYTASGPEFLDQCHDYFKSSAYEGSMLRSLSAPYGFADNCTNKENRWHCLLKRKDWEDAECEIIGIIQGKDIHNVPQELVGALELRHPNGSFFSAGSGLTDSQRLAYWTEPPLGRSARIRYAWLSDGRKPIQPQVECVFD